MGRPRASPGPDSRARLIAAATEEFAAQGLAGASLERIARRARLTKAMIYYHFKSKDALYREIIRSTFETVGARLGAIRSSVASPPDKLAAFVAGFVEEAVQRPHFPRMVMREMSESGRHFDRDTARAWVTVPEAFFGILQEGVEQGVFRPVHPLLGFLASIGPVVLLLASAPARQRAGRLLGRALPEVDLTNLAGHARTIALAVLTASAPPTQDDANGVLHASHVSPSVIDRSLSPARHARGRRVP
jgi:AcrR family transcriptional regulator